MRRWPQRWLDRLAYRFRRLGRRRLGDARDWLEHTGNLLHLSVLVALPVLIGLVTYLSDAVSLLPFLLFPPLAAGTYTLFANPESRYASPRRFVGGLTAGALCGWLALVLTARLWYGVPAGTVEVDPWAAAFGVLLTGLVTWALDIEESSAFSTALLVLVTGATQLEYVASVFLSTSIIAGVFVLWRRHVYHERARYLYRSTRGGDHVLVPVDGPHPDATAMLGARIAGAHDGGRVVLLDVVEPTADGAATDGGTVDAATEAEARLGEAAAAALGRRADRIEAEVGVPVDVTVVAPGPDRAGAVLAAARDANCDLVVAPYEGTEGRLSGFGRGLLAGETDVVIHRSVDGREAWPSVLVPVRRAGDLAHAMIDLAGRLADAGRISVCQCVATERERRAAEETLANLVETAPVSIETRVARAALADFLARVATHYALVVVGASTDRTAASRLMSPPSFERLLDVDCDVAIVHRD